ncbi:MAG: symmetrical bis(5'-nucleosyl)-tetraphosphatase [Pseudomonadota bacterium]
MAIWAVGDLQGCYEPLMRLLEKIRFDPARDTLWLTGDLINRGPHSLATLRFVKALGKNAVTVLGNHDLHLLALAAKPERERVGHPLESILSAHDAPALLKWLRKRPLIHVDRSYKSAVVHAGILPTWSIPTAQRHAREVEQVLQSSDGDRLLRYLYGNKPSLWREDLAGTARWRFIINVFTRMRMLTRRGGLNLAVKGMPQSAPKGSIPWFEAAHARGGTRVIFGHWSALGLIQVDGVVGLDTGCVWSRSLTAMRVDRKRPRFVGVSCEEIVATARS